MKKLLKKMLRYILRRIIQIEILDVYDLDLKKTVKAEYVSLFGYHIKQFTTNIMYKLILSFDIQNEKGQSIIKKPIANGCSVKLTKEDVESFNVRFAELYLKRFLAHYYASSFGVHEVHKAPSCKEGARYNYELGYSRTDVTHMSEFHSEVTEKGNNVPYIYLSGDVISLEESD